MPVSGENIRNVRSKLVVDVGRGSAGLPLVIYELNQAPSGTFNQQWRATPIPGTANLFTIQCALTGTYASINGLADVNKPLLCGNFAMPWQIVSISDPWSHNVTIQVPYTNLFWNVAADVHDTPVVLAKQDNTTGQQWMFIPPLAPT